MKNNMKEQKILEEQKSVKEQKLLKDIINVILGIVVIVFIILFLLNPQKVYFLPIALFVGGGMNIMNGILYAKNKEKSKSISYLLIGLIVIIIAVINL